LSDVNGEDPLNCLDLENQSTINEHIQPLMANDLSSVPYGDRSFEFEPDPARLELNCYCTWRDGLKQARPGFPVNGNTRSDGFSDKMFEIWRQLRWNE